MVSETGVVDDSDGAEHVAPLDEAHSSPRRRRVRVRKQDKFSRPVRVALWLGLPALLWGGIYCAIRLLD